MRINHRARKCGDVIRSAVSAVERIVSRDAPPAMDVDSELELFATLAMAGAVSQVNSWWCAQCRRPVELDKHGRCERCGSDAVVYPLSWGGENENTRA